MITIIDGSHLAYRSYHTFPYFSNSHNYPTGMIYGFFSILNSYSDQFGGNLVVVWEGKDNWRKSFYPEYKAKRTQLPDEIKQNFQDIVEVCTMAGILQIRKNGYEADDLVSFIVRQIGENIRIISGDKDLMQFISDEKKIFMLRPGKDGLELINEEAVFKAFGVGPNQIAEYLAILGDKSDNIKGFPGFGEKKTKALFDSTNQPINTLIKNYPEQAENLITCYKLTNLMDPQSVIKYIDYNDITFLPPDLVSLNSKLRWYEIKNFNARDIILSLSDPASQNNLKEKLLERPVETRFTSSSL